MYAHRHHSLPQTVRRGAEAPDAHRAYCQGLKQEGLLIASGPFVPRNGGAFLLRVPDNEAQATLDSIRENDPYTRFGLAQYEMWPWAPASAPRNSTACKSSN